MEVFVKAKKRKVLKPWVLQFGRCSGAGFQPLERVQKQSTSSRVAGAPGQRYALTTGNVASACTGWG
jgi:hypothetical protein